MDFIIGYEWAGEERHIKYELLLAPRTISRGRIDENINHFRRNNSKQKEAHDEMLV
ncbi:MAG: hypothetical protein GYA34_03035 [Chloroflexi bacterium]|nr:hypothetical protein [Chloroflexota bacterium]